MPTTELGVEIEVDWSPWLLYPQMKQPVSKREAYTRLLGRPEKVEQMRTRMGHVFEEAGLASYSLDGLLGPTLASHRLVEHARQQVTEPSRCNSTVGGREAISYICVSTLHALATPFSCCCGMHDYWTVVKGW